MQTATNPQTGEKVQWNGSQWVPMGSGSPAPSAPSGPVTVGTPRPAKPEIRQVGSQLGIVDPNTGQFTPTYSAPDKPTGGGSETSAKTRLDAITGYKAAQSIRRLVADMRQRHAEGPGATKGPLGVIDFLPTETNQGFDTAGNAARGIVGQALGFTGGQLNSVQEAEMAIGPYLPKASDFDDVSLDKINRLEALATDAEERAIALLGGIPDENGQVTPVAAQQAPAPEQADQSRNINEIEAPAQEQLTRSTGGTQTVDDPRLSGVRGEYLRRLEAGQAPGEIVSFLRQAGISDPKVLASAVKQANFRKQNPNVPIANYNTSSLDDMDVPLTQHEQIWNDAAQTAPGAFLMNAGQSVSMNTLDNAAGMMGGNEERARLAIQDSQYTNPIASTLGQISGSVMGALGGEAALAGRGMAAGLPRAFAADTAFGAGSGAGAADDGNRLGGAVDGGLNALGGSLAGAGLMRVGGSAVSPSGGKLSDLYAAGVRPTPGQRFGNTNIAGRALNATEEALQSVPIVGSAIQGARQGARDQWQVAAWNSSLGEIGEQLPKGMKPGTAPHQFAQSKFNAVYDKAREGMRVAPDAQLASEVGELGSQIGNLAEPSIRRFEAIVKNTILRRAGSTIDGPAYKKIQSELGKTIRGIRKSPSGDGELADALEELSGIIDSAARRHSDPEAVKLLDAADRGYAKFVQIEQASARGGAAKPAGTFSPNDFTAAVKGNGSRVRSKAFNQGEGLMQDFAEQGSALSDKMGNSFTTDRALVVGGTGAAAAGYAEPSTLGVLGIIGALYAPGVRKATAGAMAPRGKKAQAIAQGMKKRARITGAVGAGVALSAQKDDDQ